MCRRTVGETSFDGPVVAYVHVWVASSSSQHSDQLNTSMGVLRTSVMIIFHPVSRWMRDQFLLFCQLWLRHTNVLKVSVFFSSTIL